MQEPTSNDKDPGPRWVFGLCAQWCGVCRDWQAAFEAVARRRTGEHFVWIDIEDEAEAVGDLDIETFPTLLVGTADRVLFFGTILPSPELLERLLASLDGGSTAPAQAGPDALLQRLLARQL